MYENIKRKRQQAKATSDKHAKPLPELHVGEPVRLQPVNLKASWEKGSCVAKIGPGSYLIETESGNLYRQSTILAKIRPHRIAVARISLVMQSHQPNHYEMPRQILLQNRHQQ